MERGVASSTNRRVMLKLRIKNTFTSLLAAAFLVSFASAVFALPEQKRIASDRDAGDNYGGGEA